MFLDEAIISIEGGSGGRGCVSWRREKYVRRGGPDGGDGGNGGSVIIEADENTDTLSAFASTKRFHAEDGAMGRGKKCRGRDGDDLTLKVPPGTLVFDRTPSSVSSESSAPLLADLPKHRDRVTVARGGRGGYGNAHFISAVRQRPDFAELGEPGERKAVQLELKLIADIGIIGLPNVGKSTLIAAISAARPKIADYPFTTLTPNLGIVRIGEHAFTVCDIPGLIEGASEGRGLGDQFLRHIERCTILLHLLDLSHTLRTLIDDYHTIRQELAASSPTLAAKRELVVLNKTDLLPSPQTLPVILQSLEQAGIDVFQSISAVTKDGTDALAQSLLLILKERLQPSDQQPTTDNLSPTLPILRPHLSSQSARAYQIEREGDIVIIRGQRIEQIATMTDFRSRSGIARLRDILERIGIRRALTAMHLPEGTEIFIGPTRIDPFIDIHT